MQGIKVKVILFPDIRNTRFFREKWDRDPYFLIRDAVTGHIELVKRGQDDNLPRTRQNAVVLRAVLSSSKVKGRKKLMVKKGIRNRRKCRT